MVWQKAFVVVTLCLTFLAHSQVQKKTTNESVDKWANESASKKHFLFNFQCVTEIPTTSFIFSEDGDYFKVELIHHRGTQYAPFSDRLIVPNDMADLFEAAEVAKNTGDDLEFRWDKKSCTRVSDEIFDCVGGGESVTSAKKQIKPWNISRSLVTTQSASGETKIYKVRVRYDIEGKSYDYVMDYQLSECIVSRSAF